jgi:hypothetical protein
MFRLMQPENALVLLSRKIELPPNRHKLVNDGDSCPSTDAAMDLLECTASRLNFEAYINQLFSVIGHAGRAEPLHGDRTGCCCPASARASSRWPR